jgi:hypothetical protein
MVCVCVWIYVKRVELGVRVKEHEVGCGGEGHLSISRHSSKRFAARVFLGI